MEKGTQTLLENYVSIYERQKKCSKYTNERKVERARIPTINYQYKNIEKREREREKERERKRVDYHNKKDIV